MFRYLCIAALAAGCGRLGFDAVTTGAPGDGGDDTVDGPYDAAMLRGCYADTFNAGFGPDWEILRGGISGGVMGPDGTLAIASASGVTSIRHPEMRQFVGIDVAFDFRINDGAEGDIFVALANDVGNYTIVISAAGSDDPEDVVSRAIGTDAPVQLATRPTSVPASTWHRLQVIYRFDHSIRVNLDGAMHFEVATDTTIPQPMDAVLGFFRQCAVDNLDVSCAR